MTVHINLVQTPFIETDTGFPRHSGLNPLVEQAHRWDSFSLQSVNGWLASDLFPEYSSSSPLSFPLLEDLEMLDVCICGDNDLEIFTGVEPKLKALRLKSRLDLSSPDHFSFASLSHLELPPSRYVIEDVFGENSSLVSLKIPENIEGMDGHESEPVSYSTVEAMSIWHSNIPRSGFSVISVLPYFTFPFLKTLRLEPAKKRSFQSPWINFKPFMAFVQRSSFPLTTLHVQSLPIFDSNLVYLLIHVPTLQNLTIDDADSTKVKSPITCSFVESLHAFRTSSLHQQHAPIVPRLRSLKLVIGADTFADTSVVDMVRSRWVPGNVSTSNAGAGTSTTRSALQIDCLRECTIKFPSRVELKGVYEPLEHIEKNGMRLVVLWKSRKTEASSDDR